MRRLIPLKFFSRLLLVIMLVVTINGVHESAHAMQSHVASASEQASYSDISAPQQCPCAPLEQHKDYDGCDTCVNCTCHAPLNNETLQISYNPSVLTLHFSDPFKFLPEVYLSKFIPPQIQA